MCSTCDSAGTVKEQLGKPSITDAACSGNTLLHDKRFLTHRNCWEMSKVRFHVFPCTSRLSERTNGCLGFHLQHHGHQTKSSQTHRSFLFLHAFGKMLTSTYVNIRSFSYPIGNTPAANLLRDLRPGKEPVEILALGCGDVRNILFTLWSQQNDTCKLNFTACDLDPAIIGKQDRPFSTLSKNPLSRAILFLRTPLCLSTTRFCSKL
jgi:hypothetical protein